jgi:Protein of unknown function (DUF1553)/Protein of unknown function (DUF1549)/Planctomycete cytochrome C
MIKIRLLVFVGALVASTSAIGAEPAAPDFQRDVLPIFENHCFQCHDGRKQTAGLRLDVRSKAMHGGDSGDPAIVPKISEQSEIVLRVTTDDADARMPPEGKGQPLSPEEIASVRNWIDSGANWPDAVAHEERLPKNHWAYIAPVRPELPAVKNEHWVRNPIDRFVLARLEAEGLKPAAEADKSTLLRRMSLDLVGLPPSLGELDKVLTDSKTDALAVAANRLLASPHYGECWGRHWLDAARYADSDGYEKDKSREVWFYRDWVINALNRDLPYDQFVIAQIAGDQLPHATQDDRVATGFLRNSMVNEEGGVHPEQFRVEALFDRMDAIGKSVLGVTIQCAQCHNHKYDPISQEEYYRMFAFLNDSDEANIAVYTLDDEAKRIKVLQQIAAADAKLKTQISDWREQMAVWEEGVSGDQPEWTIVRPEVDDISTGGSKYLPLDDGSLIEQGYAPTKHRVKLIVRTDGKPITAFRLELLNDPNLPLGGPGRSVWGTCALSEFEVEAAPVSDPKKIRKVKFVRATADVNPPETALAAIFDDKSGKRRVTGSVALAIDGDANTAWDINVDPGRRNQPRKAVFVADKPIENDGGTFLNIYLNQNHGGWNSDDNQNNNLGRFRLATTGSPTAEADPLPAEVRQIFEIPTAERTPHQVDVIFSYWRTTLPEAREVNEQIEKLWALYPAGSTQLIAATRSKSRQTYVLARGDFLKPQQEVSPGVPKFLPSLLEGVPSTRLTFAKWLVDRRAPTTARAIVNRVWQAYFGTGLVETSEDLGMRCEAPVYRDLLDWLAVEFMDHGWSLKYLHKLIVDSATYRQSSRMTPEMLGRDPENHLLARGPRFRVEAEQVRDIALTASGLMNPQIGGPCAYPPLPAFLLQPPISYGPKTWPTATGPERYRRSVYTFRFRSLPYPALQTFDAPNGESSCVRRPRSNTPLQALVTLNDPWSMECAQALARQILKDGGKSDEARLNLAYRRCLSRSPSNEERAELLKFYDREKKRIADGWLNSWQLTTPDGASAKRPETVGEASPTELAAWTCVARVLLNLDETITKE